MARFLILGKALRHRLGFMDIKVRQLDAMPDVEGRPLGIRDQIGRAGHA